MKRAPDYHQKSKKIEEICANDVALKKAREEIFKELSQSVKIIKNLRNSQDESISLKACREHALLAGLYVERSEVNHSGNLVISPDHAKKVLNAAG